MGAGTAAGIGAGAGILGSALGGAAGGAAGAGQAAGGAAEGRLAANNQAIERDRIASQQYGTQQQALLDSIRGENQGAVDVGQLDLGADRNMADLYATRQRAQLDALIAGDQSMRDQARIDLDRQQFALDAPTTLTDQAVRADRLGNAMPLTLSHPRAVIPGMSGGYTPSDELRTGMKDMLTERLAQAKAGPQFDPLTQTDFRGGLLDAPTPTYQRPTLQGYENALLTPPAQTPPEEAGFWENLGGGMGTAGGILGGILGGVNAMRRPTTTPTTPPYNPAPAAAYPPGFTGYGVRF
jgi:hypothetical protein